MPNFALHPYAGPQILSKKQQLRACNRSSIAIGPHSVCHSHKHPLLLALIKYAIPQALHNRFRLSKRISHTSHSAYSLYGYAEVHRFIFPNTGSFYTESACSSSRSRSVAYQLAPHAGINPPEKRSSSEKPGRKLIKITSCKVRLGRTCNEERCKAWIEVFSMCNVAYRRICSYIK